MINGKLIIRLRAISDLDRDKWVGDMGTGLGPAFTKVLTLPVCGRDSAKLKRNRNRTKNTSILGNILGLFVRRMSATSVICLLPVVRQKNISDQPPSHSALHMYTSYDTSHVT